MNVKLKTGKTVEQKDKDRGSIPAEAQEGATVHRRARTTTNGRQGATRRDQR